jgi:hypothetical protein
MLQTFGGFKEEVCEFSELFSRDTTIFTDKTSAGRGTNYCATDGDNECVFNYCLGYQIIIDGFNPSDRSLYMNSINDAYTLSKELYSIYKTKNLKI